MKFDDMLRRHGPHDIAARALACEREGFDCLWTVESAHNPFFPVVLGATATETLEFGTDIAVAFARSPFSMAQAAWDLQDLSRGRFHLGLGTQVRAHVERRFSMPFEHPAARVTDYIRCVRAIWDTYQNGTRPDYDGPFYRFNLINPMFNAGPIAFDPPPIYLAGVNPRMCRAAGEAADGFHVHPMHSAAYLREVVLPAIDEGARTRGLHASDLSLHVPVFVAAAAEQAALDRQIDEVRRQIAFLRFNAELPPGTRFSRLRRTRQAIERTHARGRDGRHDRPHTRCTARRDRRRCAARRAWRAHRGSLWRTRRSRVALLRGTR